MTKRSKIINIMCHPPAYELFFNEPRPKINWDTPEGTWVGIWGGDWADLIGKEVLKLTDEFEYEVWQPDLRTDKVYIHNFPSGLTHKLFPAEEKQTIHGLKRIKYVTSKSICKNLMNENLKNKIILHLNGINSGISREILDLPLNCPVIVQFMGEISLPLNNLFIPQKNMFSKPVYLKQHFINKRRFKKVNLISYCSKENRNTLRRYFNKKIVCLRLGIDFDFWNSRFTRNEIKKKLGLQNDRYILLSSSRLNSLKQVDKMIEVLKRLDNHYDFQYIVTGHGTLEYQRYLESLGNTLIKKNKLKFVGYLLEEELRDFYSVADLFITTSLSEGGPISAVKAMAMEIPILSTNTGLVAQLLRRYNSGIIVPRNNYKIWEQKLTEYLCGKKVGKIDRQIIKSYFQWRNIAKEYINVYLDLFN